MCSESQEAVSVVLSRAPTEVIKKSHGQEYKFMHPQTVRLSSVQTFRKDEISESCWFIKGAILT